MFHDRLRRLAAGVAALGLIGLAAGVLALPRLQQRSTQEVRLVASTSIHLCGWDDYNGDVSLTYETHTLAMQTLSWQNLDPRPGAVEIQTSSPLPVTDQTEVIPANTARTSRDISGLGLTMQTFIINGQPRVGVPPDIHISCRYPA